MLPYVCDGLNASNIEKRGENSDLMVVRAGFEPAASPKYNSLISLMYLASFRKAETEYLKNWAS